MRESYYFQGKSGIEVPSEAEIESYTNNLFQRLPRLLPSDISKECDQLELGRVCRNKHLHIYLLALEKQLRENQLSNCKKLTMKSRYIDSASLGVVVHQQTIVELEEAIKKRLKSEQQQKISLISQNRSLRQGLEAVEQAARDKMKEYSKRINEALSSHHINRLQAELKEPYQATVSQMQAQMDLQISGLFHEVSTLEAAKDKLASELSSLARQMARRESQVSELAKKCAQLQQEKQRQLLISSTILLDFWNRKVVPKISKYSEVIAEQEILAQLQHTQEVKRGEEKKSSAFQMSQILHEKGAVKDFIIRCIEDHTKSNLSSTRLFYRYDKHHRDFGEYLKELNTPFSMVMRLDNGRICGGFCPGFNSTGQSSFLFTYSTEGTVIRMAAKNQPTNGCNFASNQLVFGFNELIIANNRGREVKLNSSSFGGKYFEKLSQFAEIDESNTCRFQELEFHQLSLEG